MRWRHPERGLVAPMQLIPLAETTGLIVPIGAFVLRRACHDAKGWPDDIKVSVNLSAIQFRRMNIFEIVVSALADSGLPPHKLELEVTETILLDDEEEHSRVLQRLKNLGVSIALDDFGTGYSSLSYLKHFPFDRIKIDRSFIMDVEENEGSGHRKRHRSFSQTSQHRDHCRRYRDGKAIGSDASGRGRFRSRLPIGTT